MKKALIIILVSFHIISIGQTKNDTKKYHKQHNPIELKKANKKNHDKVTSLIILNYTDSIFPNNELMKFKNIEYLSVYGRELKKTKHDTIELDVLKIQIDSTKLNYFKNLKYLEFVNFDFTSFPIEICSLNSLVSLSIALSFVEKIPNEISNLKSLEVLTLRLNNISTIPTEISKMDNLISLDLCNNHINKLPIEILEIKKLEKVIFSNYESIKKDFIGYKWSFYTSVNKINYLEDIEILERILKKENIKQLGINIQNRTEKKKILLKLSDNKLKKKIKWQLNEM